MSVSSGWRHLPPHRIPERLDPTGALGASGNDADCCWRFGDGPFHPGPAAPDLELVLKAGQTNRGNLAPDRAMPLPDYQQALEATQDGWTIDEN